MRKAGIFAAAHRSVASYRSAVLADSPFCYFPLNDATTPTDVMGNITPASVTGVTLGAAGIGDGSTAAAFDGGAAIRGIAMPESGWPTPGTITAFTVELLAKATNMTTARAIFRWDQVMSIGHDASAGINAYTSVGAWPNRAGSSAYAEGAPTATHHWVLSWDGANARLYRDGVQVGTAAQSGTMADNTPASVMRIGSSDFSGAPTFLGTIAGFAYYTSALSAARILAHAQAAGVA